jgi:putative ABC transport system permease protein
LQGRTFTEADNETARPVAVVNQTMARKLWPSEDPVGKRFSIKSATGVLRKNSAQGHAATFSSQYS